jgi:hypothetical protein
MNNKHILAMISSFCHSAATASLKKYDVFISFRGEDTRAGFTSHLHAALNRSYLETYIDYRIEKGNQVWTELVEAIKDSTLFLVVFSENYANSTWCLNEIVEIMECRNKNEEDNVVVIPVFYQIEPSHVRKQTGSYGSALEKHKKQGGKNDDKMMQNWKNALFQAANLSGFDSNTYRYLFTRFLISKTINFVSFYTIIYTFIIVIFLIIMISFYQFFCFCICIMY